VVQTAQSDVKRPNAPPPTPAYGKHQRLQRQRERAKVLSSRVSGKPLDDAERRNLLLILQDDIDNGYPRERAISRAALRHGTGKQTLRDLLDAYDPKGLGAALPASSPAPPPPPDCAAQGRPRKFVTLEQGDKARSLVKAAHDDGRTITYTELYKTVRDEVKQPMVGYHSFRRQLRQRFQLRFLRCGKVVPRSLFSAEHLKLRERFVVELSDALDQQKKGTAIVVWYDESFCHQHIRRFGTVCDMGDATQWAARRRAAPAAAIKSASKGKLFVICHAATEHGLLVGRNADGTRVAPPAKGADAAGVFATAEWIWQTAEDNPDPDYHNHVTSDTIVQYFERRLFPAVRQLFPGRRIVTVLDNSPNHTAKDDDYVSPATATKEQMVEYLKSKSDFKALHVTRDGRKLRFTPGHWLLNPRKKNPRTGGPSKEEVASALNDFYIKRPDAARSKLERLFAKEVCALCAAVRCAFAR
jgi:hypothetical protein